MDDDPLTPVDVRGLPFPVLFAHHHLTNLGCDARHVAALDHYQVDRLFVRRSQLEGALTALEEMVADYRHQLELEERQRGGLSVSATDAGGLAVASEPDER